ncbi:uncharacterized protein [Amphiura filiformis]|uniref:uncharacterized protein n=1 Tax=Amphiura filiformis TaxID=82378 RepID=UPI003B210050
MKFFLICLFAVLTITESSSKFTYPKGLPCKIYNGTSCDCSNRQLSSIPLLKGHNVKSLDFSYNQLQTVYGISFIHLTSLQHLDLSHNQLEAVNGKSFIHLTSLLSLDLSNNWIMDITNVTFSGLNKLETLDLSYQGNYQSYPTLHGSPFYSTASLKKLFITDSGLCSLSPLVFSGLHELQELDISWNNMDSFPESIFQGLTNLTRLDAVAFRIDSLSVALFKDLNSVEYLDLSRNLISSLPETLFANLTNLEVLDLSWNIISSNLDTVFVNLTHLTYLDISHNSLSSTPCKAIVSLPMLSILNMSGNNFDYVTCSIENMNSLKELSTSYNIHQDNDTEYWNVAKWSELITKLPATLSTLYLGVSGKAVFQPVMPGSLNSSVSLLTICFYCTNYFDVSVEDDAFSMFLYLKKLSINTRSCSTKNKLTHLSKYAFRGLFQLKALDLSYVGLSEFSYETLEVLADTLEHLNLSNNEIQDIHHDGRYMRSGLKSLDISRNPINHMDLGSLGNVTNVYLNYLTNPNFLNISTFNMALKSIYISVEQFTTVYYDDFPLPLCASSLALEDIAFSKLQFTKSKPMVWGNCSHLKALSISDSGGVHLIFKGKIDNFAHLEKLTLTNCKLSLIDQFLLESLSLQYLDLSGNNIENINENDLSSLVNLKHLDLSHNEIKSFPANQFHYMSHLTYLNLAGNKLGNLNDLKSLYGLQTLIVSGNALTTLPASLMKIPYDVQHVEFGDNLFSCTCDIQPLQHWILTDTKTYIDPLSPYLCNDPAIREDLGITEFSLDCSLHLENYIAPSVSGLFVICVIVSIIYIYKYRWRIHYKCWILCYQRRYQRYIDNDDDADINSDDEGDVDAPYEAPIMRRRYHAYVAYHRDNEAWINDQLIPNIEDGPEHFRLCLKERGDIPAGHYILNAICHGIKQSRKTIAVLSENFMDDGWCHYQLHFARMRMVMDNADVLILVQIGEIGDRKKTLLLRQLLCYKEVLKWPEDPNGQELFWNQLKMKLRKPGRVDRRFDAV